MVPYAAHPGRDVGMTEDDYAWLLHECRANADWQLNVRVSFAGRLLKSDRLKFEYRGQPTYAGSLGWPPYLGDGQSVGGESYEDGYSAAQPFCSLELQIYDPSAVQPGDVCGPPFGAYRARVQPLRQEPEWQLNDFDVQEAWRQVDGEMLDRCTPAAMLDLARDVVESLGHWPQVRLSCDCPQDLRLEVRLALILQAYIAKPSNTLEASACKAELKAMRQRTMIGFSAAQPDNTKTLARPVSAEQPDVLTGSRWLSKLRTMNLHIKPIEGKLVFAHAPSKSILKESLQEEALRRLGVFEPLHLWSEATKPWDRFFMFDRDFVAYNHAGMRAEDPNAHKWNASKLWIDYTPYVSSKDWTKALLLRIQLDNQNIHNLLRERKRRQASSPSSCTCGRAWGLLAACECQSDDIQDKIVHDDIMNVAALTFRVGCSIWDWFVGEHGLDAATSVLRDVRAALTGTWLQRRLQFFKAIVVEGGYSSDPSTRIWNFDASWCEPTKYAKYLLHDNAHCFYALEYAGQSMPLLFWAGGTYARRPEDFPQEQSSAAWLEEHLLPLDIKAPGFLHHDSLEGLAKTWSLAKWHGQAPHPFAIKEPFPYATASMRSYCDDYLDAAWCRGSPRCSFSR